MVVTAYEARIALNCWKVSGDEATLVIQRIGQMTDQETFLLRRGMHNAATCFGYELVSLDNKGRVHLQLIRNYWDGTPLSEVSDLTDNVESVFSDLVKEYLTKIDYLAGRLRGDRWEIHAGRSPKVAEGIEARMYSYALVAELLVVLEGYGSNKPLQQIAELLEISYNTAKTRIRICREMDLLTSPGQGIKSSKLTERSLNLLERGN
jgi:hypothetical protein